MYPINSLQSHTGVSRAKPRSAADPIHLGHVPLAAQEPVAFTIAKPHYFSSCPISDTQQFQWPGTAPGCSPSHQLLLPILLSARASARPCPAAPSWTRAAGGQERRHEEDRSQKPPGCHEGPQPRPASIYYKELNRNCREPRLTPPLVRGEEARSTAPEGHMGWGPPPSWGPAC